MAHGELQQFSSVLLGTMFVCGYNDRLLFNDSCACTNSIISVTLATLLLQFLNQMPAASGYLETVCCKLLSGGNALLFPLLILVWDIVFLVKL